MRAAEAKAIAAERNGTPREDDWELAEAARVLSGSLEVFNLSAPSLKNLLALGVGESMVFKEAAGTVNPGASAQGYAARADVKIATAKCLLICPRVNSMDICVVVTRLA
jgi:hypothetical protein